MRLGDGLEANVHQLPGGRAVREVTGVDLGAAVEQQRHDDQEIMPRTIKAGPVCEP